MIFNKMILVSADSINTEFNQKKKEICIVPSEGVIGYQTVVVQDFLFKN